ncbi:MAG: hypothetical protein DWQ42_07430 [Planctomycetota bacterium]|nr:MAG: hypothetical protein DWQ42_07430 [Planctomycetota bacterium]REK37874.1 MAG: hypothetical protein DWQ46_21680 [Planctomycetota bacterium]
MTLLFLITFATVTTVMLAVAFLIRDVRAARLQRLQQRLDGSLEAARLEEPIALERRAAPGTLDHDLLELLARCGNVLDPPAALTIVAACGLVGCAFPLLVWESLLGGAVGLVSGAALPILWWKVAARRRMAAIAKALPDTFDALADALRGGRSLEQAAEMIAAESQGPLAQEFDYCASQLRLGHAPTAVLQRMLQRVPLAEFKLFATAVAMHQQTGGNLAHLIERLSRSVRDRQEFQGHLNAATAGSRLSAVGLIAVSVLGVAALLLIDPGYLQRLISYRLGPTLLAIAGVLLTVGSIWLWRILRIKY